MSPSGSAAIGRAGTRRGFTLVELLVAAIIMSISLTALCGSWIAMINSVRTTDKRAIAAEIGRQVTERILDLGFINQKSQLPPSTSSPTGSVTGNWTSDSANFISPEFADTRWFNMDGFEVGCINSSNSSTCASGFNASTAVFVVQSYLDFTTNTSRPDLSLETIHVIVSTVKPNGQPDTQLFTEDLVLTEGGLL
jgi:prepilin-type N-terminal cleavage/methylation domain-containing protein